MIFESIWLRGASTRHVFVHMLGTTKCPPLFSRLASSLSLTSRLSLPGKLVAIMGIFNSNIFAEKAKLVSCEDVELNIRWLVVATSSFSNIYYRTTTTYLRYHYEYRLAQLLVQYDHSVVVVLSMGLAAQHISRSDSTVRATNIKM